ncbi:hypothetical protein J6590_040115 [Homalodisca vitripennis]|nr:hypothetical protein J6590_040115 [Homalodisca vitripennis]
MAVVLRNLKPKKSSDINGMSVSRINGFRHTSVAVCAQIANSLLRKVKMLFPRVQF